MGKVNKLNNDHCEICEAARQSAKSTIPKSIMKNKEKNESTKNGVMGYFKSFFSFFKTEQEVRQAIPHEPTEELAIESNQNIVTNEPLEKRQTEMKHKKNVSLRIPKTNKKVRSKRELKSKRKRRTRTCCRRRTTRNFDNEDKKDKRNKYKRGWIKETIPPRDSESESESEEEPKSKKKRK